MIRFLQLVPGEESDQVRSAIDRVITRGWFVLGPELEAFERTFAQASGAAHAVGVGNGTDAITLLLRASGIAPGDEVIVPGMTAAFTALAVIAASAAAGSIVSRAGSRSANTGVAPAMTMAKAE